MLLAIDTATSTTGLACYDERGLRAEAVWESGRDHAAQLLPTLDLLLAQLRLAPRELRAVAVGLGPGSWSGLRVGLSTAKGIALAHGLPLLGVVTLDALAYQHQRPALAIIPLVHLGRGRYGTASYRVERGELQRVGDVVGRTLPEVAEAVQGRTLFCGELAEVAQDELRAALGTRAVFVAGAAALRRPGYLAELAWRRLLRGEADDLATLEPLYLGQAVKQAG